MPLTKKTPIETWIDDFVNSDNPKFAGKSKEKRRQMAIAAYYGAKNESNEMSNLEESNDFGDDGLHTRSIINSMYNEGSEEEDDDMDDSLRYIRNKISKLPTNTHKRAATEHLDNMLDHASRAADASQTDGEGQEEHQDKAEHHRNELHKILSSKGNVMSENKKKILGLTEATDDDHDIQNHHGFRKMQDAIYDHVIKHMKAPPEIKHDAQNKAKQTDAFWVHEFDDAHDALEEYHHPNASDKQHDKWKDELRYATDAVHENMHDHYIDPMNHPPGYKPHDIGHVYYDDDDLEDIANKSVTHTTKHPISDSIEYKGNVITEEQLTESTSGTISYEHNGKIHTNYIHFGGDVDPKDLNTHFNSLEDAKKIVHGPSIRYIKGNEVGKYDDEGNVSRTFKIGKQIHHDMNNIHSYNHADVHLHFVPGAGWTKQKLRGKNTKASFTKESVQTLLTQISEGKEEAGETFHFILSEKITEKLSQLRERIADKHFNNPEEDAEYIVYDRKSGKVKSSHSTYAEAKQNSKSNEKIGSRRKNSDHSFVSEIEEDIRRVQGKSYGNNFKTDEDGNEVDTTEVKPKQGRGRPKSDETIQAERGNERAQALADNPFVPKPINNLKSPTLLKRKTVKFDLDKGDDGTGKE